MQMYIQGELTKIEIHFSANLYSSLFMNGNKVVLLYFYFVNLCITDLYLLGISNQKDVAVLYKYQVTGCIFSVSYSIFQQYPQYYFWFQ